MPVEDGLAMLVVLRMSSISEEFSDFSVSRSVDVNSPTADAVGPP